MSTTTAAFAVVVLDRVAEGFAGKRTSALSAGAVKADEGAGEFAIRRGEWLTRGPYRRVMAKKHITQMIDDLDGRIIEDGTTLTFSLEGRAYEIDLSHANAARLRDAFHPFISAARVAGSTAATVRRTPRGRAIPTRDLTDVRTWAHENGYAINERGRISSAVLEAYDAAH